MRGKLQLLPPQRRWPPQHRQLLHQQRQLQLHLQRKAMPLHTSGPPRQKMLKVKSQSSRCRLRQSNLVQAPPALRQSEPPHLQRPLLPHQRRADLGNHSESTHVLHPLSRPPHQPSARLEFLMQCRPTSTTLLCLNGRTELIKPGVPVAPINCVYSQPLLLGPTVTHCRNPCGYLMTLPHYKSSFKLCRSCTTNSRFRNTWRGSESPRLC